MLVGIEITGSFISGLAAGLTRSKIKSSRNKNDPKQILKIRLAKEQVSLSDELSTHLYVYPDPLARKDHVIQTFRI
jgi:hypothetical protein